MPDLKQFRENVTIYRKRRENIAGRPYTQAELAKEIGLSADELGHRLRGNGRLPLSQDNILKIVETLATWETLSLQEAEELLGCMDYPVLEIDWRAAPWSELHTNPSLSNSPSLSPQQKEAPSKQDTQTRVPERILYLHTVVKGQDKIHSSIWNWSWKILLAMWGFVLIPLAISSWQVVAALPSKTFPDSLYSTFLGTFFLPTINRIVTFSVLGGLLLLTIIVGIAAHRDSSRRGNRKLRQYLRRVITAHKGLSPQGIAHQSEALLSVNVPLDEIYVTLHSVPDRPFFDVPTEQQRLLEELRHRTDLEPVEREQRIQDLRRIWVSHEQAEVAQLHQIYMEEIFQHLTAETPAAILLGAPGSGKSITLRWFALHMAQAYLRSWPYHLSHKFFYRFLYSHIFNLVRKMDILDAFFRWRQHHFPYGQTPIQIPVLLPIREYASRLSTHPSLSVEQFLQASVGETVGELLMQKLEMRQCLLLFDGLDEVPSDSMRRQVAAQISAFLANYTESSGRRGTNRFIITSRIVGYEAGPFTQYAHYTLQAFADEQIKQFLTRWCPAVERYQTMLARNMRKPTKQQQSLIAEAGVAQREMLLQAFDHNPSLKRLAMNPLMLTILVLIQRAGKALPHRRIDLYEVVSKTFLHHWNLESGRRLLPSGETQLAERILSQYAYRMCRQNTLLTTHEVTSLARQEMEEFYARSVSASDVDQFVETLRRSSGLFVESGQGLFSFMHRTFQEYYVALYLLDKEHFSFPALEEFASHHYQRVIWHEPLLLVIAYKSGLRDREEQRQANILIERIEKTPHPYDDVLHRNLLFAAQSIVDCEIWAITGSLQSRIARTLFALYGDSYGQGRYERLRKEIETIVLLWLRVQPGEVTIARPPLLDAWHQALCDAANPVCQEGAIHLLAALAPDFPSCPSPVAPILLPPLLQLAEVAEITCPPESIHRQLPQPAARPASLRISEYAFVILRLLDEMCPATWLHQTWLTWNKEHPELLERLTQHALELNYLLTPTAFPTRKDRLKWEQQLTIGWTWKKRARKHPQTLQVDLLQASTKARFPHALLLHKLLLEEMKVPGESTLWQETWKKILEEEMARASHATYQACLHLRLLIGKNRSEAAKEVATTLQMAVTQPNQTQQLALTTLTNMHLFTSSQTYYIEGRYIQDLRRLRENDHFMGKFGLLRDLHDLRDLRYLQDIQDLDNLRDLQHPGGTWDMEDLEGYLFLNPCRDIRDIRSLLDYPILVRELCAQLEQQSCLNASALLLCLYSVLVDNEKVALQQQQLIQASLQKFIQASHGHALEEKLLVTAIERALMDASTKPDSERPPSILADEQVIRLDTLQTHAELNKQDVEELLAACIDIRVTTKETHQKYSKGKVYSGVSVCVFAVGLLSKVWHLDSSARKVVVQALDHHNAVICGAGALLLRNGRYFSAEECKLAAQKMRVLLKENELSQRLLDPPEAYMPWRLDEILFETLQELVEQIKEGD